DTSVSWSSGEVGVFFLFVMGVGVVSSYMAFFITLWLTGLTISLITLKTGYVSWVPPNRCQSIQAWVSHSWDFASRSTAHSALRNTGFRCLGFEVALAGRLSP